MVKCGGDGGTVRTDGETSDEDVEVRHILDRLSNTLARL